MIKTGSTVLKGNNVPLKNFSGSTKDQETDKKTRGIRCPSPLAEREGFEPSVRLHVRSISNAVHSTALSPLQASPTCEKREVFSSLKHGNAVCRSVKKRTL